MIGLAKFVPSPIVPSGNNWSGWKFSQSCCDMLGESLVTRNRSGGVAGIEYPLKGELARVGPREGRRDAPLDREDGRYCSLGRGGEPRKLVLWLWEGSRDGVTAGV